MKRLIWLPGCIVMICLFAGCGRTAYVAKDKNYDFAAIKTYAWVKAQKDNSKNKINRNDLADNKIKQSIDRNLAESGWRQVKKKPDVLLVYDVDINREHKSVNDPIYSQPLERWYYNPYRGTYATMYYPTQLIGFDNRTETVTEGTLTLTILRADTGKTIWQGWTTSEVNGRRMTDKEIDDNVKTLIKKLDK